jgi:hypothetical protein
MWRALAFLALLLATAALGQSIEGGGAPVVSPNIFHPSGSGSNPCTGHPAGGQVNFNNTCNAVYYVVGYPSP